MSEAEVQARFERLQEKLVPLWKSIQSLNPSEQTIVVVPSMSVDAQLNGAQMQAYEERLLFLLFLLRQPRARMLYVTSMSIQPAIVDYYLSQLPGVIASHARERLQLFTPLDGSTTPLSAKLLARPRLLARIRAAIPDPDRAHLVPFNTTSLERDLAVALGIPMYGADPRFLPLGTKSGCRKIFAEEGVEHALGAQDIRDLEGVIDAIAMIRKRKPGVRQVLVKLNDGVSGEGNALVDVEGAPAPGSAPERAQLAERVRTLRPELPGATYDWFFGKLAALGGVVEERITGDEFRSPSVQMRVTPLGAVEVLSTHDQLLGGASGQSFLGASFPADAAYAALITREAVKVGRRLAREGVLGRFAVDFVTVRSQGEPWTPYAIELNLRKGGTTHPFLTLQFLTDGAYDPEQAVFTTPTGRSKFFVASDHVESPLYRVLSPTDLFEVAAHHGLQFDQTRQTGVVYHMMSALGENGRVGLTAIADSPTAARELYARAVAALDEEALSAAATPPAAPPWG